MPKSPSEIVTTLLKRSLAELKYVESGVCNFGSPNHHQLLLPESRDGLYNALAAYRELLVEAQIVVPMRRAIKALVAEYDTEWTKLLDAVRDADKSLAPFVKEARTARKAAHSRFVAILTDGQENGQAEYAALTAAFTSLSEAMGENSQAAAKKSRKGIPHETFATPIPTASAWSGVSEPTIRRYWKRPLKGIPQPPLNQTGTAEVRKRVLQNWGDQYRAAKAGAHEANAKNHAIPFASVGKTAKRKAGITD